MEKEEGMHNWGRKKESKRERERGGEGGRERETMVVIGSLSPPT